MFYSPLRYPGGKGKLTPFIEMLIEAYGHKGGTYIEPFAGGAGVAIELLERDIVSRIVINDLDGNRFEVPDIMKLTVAERKKLDLFI